MSRTVERTTAQGYRGMKRSTRVSMIAGVAVFLTLVSGVSFAAWTASSTKTATAATGAVALTTATTSGASTISALGPYTYTATNQTVTKPITVRNTGTVDASVSSVTISRTGTLAGNQVAVKFWVGTSSACAATTPVVSSTLAGGTVSLSTLNITLASTGSAILCSSTTFTGSTSSSAGNTTTATFAINSSAGTNWNTTDALTTASRSFTQNVVASTTPNAPGNIACVDDTSSKNSVLVSWTSPSGFTTPNGGYNVYFDGVLDSNTTNTNIEISGKWLTTDVTVRAVASNGTLSPSSAVIEVRPSGHGNGISCES